MTSLLMTTRGNDGTATIPLSLVLFATASLLAFPLRLSPASLYSAVLWKMNLIPVLKHTRRMDQSWTYSFPLLQPGFFSPADRYILLAEPTTPLAFMEIGGRISKAH